MFSITCAQVPAHVPISTETKKKRTRHWRQHMYTHASHDDVSNRALMKGRDKIRELEVELEKYKRVNAKLERMAKWNLRSSQSTLTTTHEMLQVLQDTFGDEAFEKK
jgi:hypothetical protein